MVLVCIYSLSFDFLSHLPPLLLLTHLLLHSLCPSPSHISSLSNHFCFLSFLSHDGIGAIYASTNNGTSFKQIGAVSDPGASGGLCCTVLFELPSQVGSMKAGKLSLFLASIYLFTFFLCLLGTLLWAGSIGQGVTTNRRMSINLWQSTDVGHSW